MSRYTDENGEQLYPNDIVIDHQSPEEQLKQYNQEIKIAKHLMDIYKQFDETKHN